VLADQLGVESLERITTIRRKALAFRAINPTNGTSSDELRKELHALLDVDLPQQLNIIRSFSYFSHLLNLAEDCEMKVLEAERPEEERGEVKGSISYALKVLQAHGVSVESVQEWLSTACITPVLTAHPTEVQRRSILECEGEIGRLLQARMLVGSERERKSVDARIQRLMLQLWQTAMLRLVKLQVSDEIDNALIFYKRTFLHCIPRLYQDLEEQLRRGWGDEAGKRQQSLAAVAACPQPLPQPFLQIGSWIGGDRDGNPFVNAQTLQYAMSRQAGVLFEHYLESVSAVSSGLSFSLRLVTPSREVLALADASHGSSEVSLPSWWGHIKDEPYRMACAGIYARVAATASTLLPDRPPPPPPPPPPPTPLPPPP